MNQWKCRLNFRHNGKSKITEKSKLSAVQFVHFELIKFQEVSQLKTKLFALFKLFNWINISQKFQSSSTSIRKLIIFAAKIIEKCYEFDYANEKDANVPQWRKQNVTKIMLANNKYINFPVQKVQNILKSTCWSARHQKHIQFDMRKFLCRFQSPNEKVFFPIHYDSPKHLIVEQSN